MADDVKRLMEEIKNLTLTDKSLAYGSLLLLQRSSAEDTSSIQTLALCSPPLLPALLSDIHHQDEEIAAQALKCMGFMLYHPSLVSSISEGFAGSALDSLARLIVTTKLKAICNLGVWCISVQQLGASVVECCIGNVLKAIVYAIDNPFGSLSTTFEAVQAVTKLATQLTKKISGIANIWLPPIYRRLISNNKKERDIAERCLMKIKSIICPPPPALSKAVAQDLMNNLLASLLDLLNNSQMKVCVIQAWGWYICLLGTNVLNNRYLVNQMLKIPEQTFTDTYPQVQIASLVAWENLIEGFLSPQIINLEMNTTQEAANQSITSDCCRVSEVGYDELAQDTLRRIKVLMVPLQGIISSKCDISVRISCLSTWHHLLHKLDILVNHPSILQTTFMPITEVIFSRKPDNDVIYLWEPCLNLFDQYISGEVESKEMDFVPSCPCEVTSKNGISISYASNQYPWMHSPIKWQPWKLCNLDFTLKLFKAIVSHSQITPLDPEIRTFTLSSALRIFKSIMQGVKAETQRSSIPDDMIELCLNTILKFTKDFCEGISLSNNRNKSHDLLWMAFRSVEFIREELGSMLLAIPLYQVALDLMYIKDVQSSKVSWLPFVHVMSEDSVGYMDMVSPVMYTTFLPLSVLAQFVLDLSEIDCIPRAIQHVKFLLFSMNPAVNLHAAVCFLYIHMNKPLNEKISSLVVWRVIAKSLKESIDCVDMSFLGIKGTDATYSVVYWFLCYPLVLFCHENMSANCSSLCLNSSQSDLLLETSIQVWTTLFDYLNCVTNPSIRSSSSSCFLNGLCELLIKVLDESYAWQHDIMKHSLDDSQNFEVFLLLCEMLICILGHMKMVDTQGLRVSSLGGKTTNFSTIEKVLDVFERFLVLSLMIMRIDQKFELMVICRSCRVFDAMVSFVGSLCLKQDILKLIEVISNPLAQWFSFCYHSSGDTQERSVAHKLHCLWANIMICLQRSRPPIIFDSFLLRLQASLLQTALDHPYSPISNATVDFWKATYGKKRLLEIPDCLLPVLEKLSRNERITLQSKRFCLRSST